MTELYPLRLPPSFRGKIWGVQDLGAIFGLRPEPIGEAWYSFEENCVANGAFAGERLASLMARFGTRLMGSSFKALALRRRSADPPEPGGSAELSSAAPYFPILTKLLFTSEKLSVQVHPDDAYAMAHEQGPGKTEAWYVIQGAESGVPGEQQRPEDYAVALGLKEPLAGDELRRAAETGAIAANLNWVKVREGDVVFVPPGTLHAIGPGLVLFEVQQNSDLTYRFFDYGRKDPGSKFRPLHLDKAVAVTRPDARPRPHRSCPLPPRGCRRELLAGCAYFAAERLVISEEFVYQPAPARMHLLTFLHGEGRIGGEPYRAGDAYLIPAEAEAFSVAPSASSEALLCYVPDLAALRAELESAHAADADVRKVLIEL